MTRLVTVAPSAKAGSLAGSKNERGYVVARVDNRNYRLHRLAWLWMTGAWPKEEIDHINGDRSDNRWCNLREATHSENMRNKGIHPLNTTGVKGVIWHRETSRWKVQIKIDRRSIFLGYFDDLSDARIARENAEKIFHGEFIRQ